MHSADENSPGQRLEQPLANRVVFSASRFARVVNQAANIPVSPVSMRTLGYIEREGPQRISHMATYESISQPAMTSAVNRLADDGLVVRQPDATDARAQRVAITDRGLQLLHEFRAQVAAVIQPQLDALSPDDLAALVRSVEVFESLTDDLTGKV